MMNSVEPAADIDDQALVRRRRQRVGSADVDQAGFLAAGNDLDRKAERCLGLRQELHRVLGDAQGVGGDGAHRPLLQPAQALAEIKQAIERARLRCRIETLFGIQPGGQTHGFLKGIQRIDLVANHPSNLQAETVGTQIDGSQGIVCH